MARLMKDWLRDYLTEELKLAIEWKRKTPHKQPIKAEPADDFKPIKQEPPENPASRVPCVTQRIYEDDGSNLRAKLCRTVDVQSVLQIVGFVSYENPVQAILSDSYTRVRATFTSAAIEKFTNKEKRRITERTRGGVINIYGFELVATRHGPAQEHISLLITNFVYLGGNSAQFGDPRPIEDDGNMRQLLQELSTIWRDGATDSDDNAYLPDQAVGSQDWEPVADSQLGLSSQTQLATQLPKTTLPASPGVKNAQSGKDRAHATVTDTSNILKLLYIHPKVNSSTSRKGDAKSPQLAPTTKNVAENREHFHSPKSPTTFNVQRSNNGPSPPLPLSEGRAPSDLTVGGQATAKSAAVPKDLLPSPKQSSATKEDNTLNHVLAPNLSREASIKDTLLSGARIPRHGSVMTLSQLDRSVLAISLDQQKIIDRLESWLPSEPGSRFPLANIPVTTLQSLKDRNEELTEQDVTSPPIRAGVAKSPNCDKRSEEGADDVLTGLSHSSSESENDSEDSPYEWGSSPSRTPQEVLPPDTPQIPMRTPNRGMFSRPPLNKPPEYSGFETDSSNSDSKTHSSLARRLPTKAGWSADLMEIDRHLTTKVVSRRKRGSQLSTPMHGRSSQNSEAAVASTSPIIKGGIPGDRPSSQTSAGPKSASKRRHISTSDTNTSDVEMTGVADEVGQGDGSSASIIFPQTTDIPPSPAQAQQEQQVQVAETPGSPAPRHPIARTGPRPRRSYERAPSGIALQHQEHGTHDLRLSTSMIPATLQSPRQPLGKSFPMPHPERDAMNGEQTVREFRGQSPHLPKNLKTVSKTVDTSSPNLLSDIGLRSSDTQASRPNLSAFANGRTTNIESTISPNLVGNQLKRKVEGPLSGNPTKRNKKTGELDSFGFSQEQLPSQDPRRTGREVRREFFRQERLSKHINHDTREYHERSPLMPSQHQANLPAEDSEDVEMPNANHEPASARIERSAKNGTLMGSAELSHSTQGSREVALGNKPSYSAKVTATPTGSPHIAVHGLQRRLNRNSDPEGKLQMSPAKLKRKVPSSSLMNAGGSQASDANRTPIRPRESDTTTEARPPSPLSPVVDGQLPGTRTKPRVPEANGSVSRPVSYFAAPKASLSCRSSVDSTPATPQERPKSREAQDTQVPLQRPISIRDKAASLSGQHPAGGYISIFEQFTQTYPQYKGTVKHFRGLCRMIKKLQVDDKMVHPSLWDDFIIRHRFNYQPYLLKCSAAGEDPIPFVKFYNNEVEAPKFLKRVLTPATIDVALSELDTSSEPTEKAHSLVASTKKINPKPGQTRFPLGPSSAVLTTALSRESRTDVDAGRPILPLDRNFADRNRQNADACDTWTTTRPRFTVDSYRPVYTTTENSIQYRPDHSNPASSAHPASLQQPSSTHPHRSLPWSTNPQNESKLSPSSRATPTPTSARRAHSAQTFTTPLVTDGESIEVGDAEKHTIRGKTATAAKMGKTPITDRTLGSDGKPRRFSSALPQKRAASSVMKDDAQRRQSGPPIFISSKGESTAPASSTLPRPDAAARPIPSQPPSSSNKPIENDSSAMQCGQADAEEQQDPDPSLAVFLRNYKRLKILDGVLGPPDDEDDDSRNGLGRDRVSEGTEDDARVLPQHQQGKLDVLGWCL